MKVIIAGSRDIYLSPQEVQCLIAESGFKVTELVSGKCRGVDESAEAWANLWGIPVKPFPYRSEFGKAGGPIRNREMAEYAEALIAVPTPSSKGTFDMIEQWAKKRRPLYVRTLKEQGKGGGV